MSNVVVLSKAGSLAALEEGLEAVATQRQRSLALLLAQVTSMDLLVGPVDSEVASVVVSMEDEVGAASPVAEAAEASRIEVATEEEVVEVLATKVAAAAASPLGVATEETVLAQTVSVPLQVHPQALEVHEPQVTAEEEAGMVAAQVLPIAMARLVGMTHVVVVAHMMIDLADKGTAVATIHAVAVAATWSR